MKIESAWIVRWLWLGSVTLAMVGCAATPSASTRKAAEPASQVQEPEMQDLLAKYREQLGLADQPAISKNEESDTPFHPPTVYFNDSDKPDADGKRVRASTPASGAIEPPIEAATDRAEPSGGQARANAVASAAGQAQALQSTTGELSRDGLLVTLRRQVRAQETPMRAAVINAALTLADASPGEALDPTDLVTISKQQAVNVQRFHQLLVALSDDLSDGDGELDREAALAHMQDTLGPQALEIRALELCTEVRSYGDYTPLQPKTFIAGKAHPVIIYTEVDHFRHQPVDRGHFEVRLTQDVVLYEDGGVPVWSEKRALVQDRSRNRRRDFFTVQPVTLPDNLTVGAYQLKVTVRDEYGDTRAERGLPLEVIAGTAGQTESHLSRTDPRIESLLDRRR